MEHEDVLGEHILFEHIYGMWPLLDQIALSQR
jgi:hypothetical protein